MKGMLVKVHGIFTCCLSSFKTVSVSPSDTLEDYLEADDFVGADLARKFLQ
jgi:hypothetical protein